MVLLNVVRNTVAKRLPMIKFRKGGNESAAAAAVSHTQGIAEVKTNVQHTQTRASSGQAIEDWQLPPRYRRRLIDPKECDFINAGGVV